MCVWDEGQHDPMAPGMTWMLVRLAGWSLLRDPALPAAPPGRPYSGDRQGQGKAPSGVAPPPVLADPTRIQSRGGATVQVVAERAMLVELRPGASWAGVLNRRGLPQASAEDLMR